MSEAVFASSVLILAVIALRALLGGKVRARLIYTLWLPVALRLLIPFDLPVSAVSAVSSDALHDVDSVLSETVGGRKPSVGWEGQTARAELDVPQTGQSAVIPRKVSAAAPAATRRDVLRMVWYAGMLAVGGAVVFSNIRFYRRLRKIRKRFEIAAPCPVYLAEGLPSPCLYGRAVYLPVPLEGESLRHVLAHELTHLRHGDSFWAVLTSVCLTVYWFHPLVWLAAALSRRDCELACDEGALSGLAPGERVAYGRTLLALVGSKNRDFLCHATMMSKSAMGTRIKRIAEQPRTRAAAVLALAVGVLIACVTAYTSPDRYISREVKAQIEEGCRSENLAECIAWEHLKNELLPAYRRAVAAHEDGIVRLEAVQLTRSRLGLAMGREYNSLSWELRPERLLREETAAAAGLHQWEGREWPLWGGSIYECTKANGDYSITDEDAFYEQLQKEFAELDWTKLELFSRSDDFREVAVAFMDGIGKIFMSGGGQNSGSVYDYQIVRAEVYDTLPDDRDHFAFEAEFRFTPVDFPNAHWLAGGGVDENPDGTITYSTEIALARNADNVWRVTSNGAAVRAAAGNDTRWYYNIAEDVPGTLITESNDRLTIARAFLEQYAAQLRRIYEQGNLNGAQSVAYSSLHVRPLEDTNLMQKDLLPEAYDDAFYASAEAIVSPPAPVMPWVWYDIWGEGAPRTDGRREYYIGLLLWLEGGEWHGQFLDPWPEYVIGLPDSPDGRWKLGFGWATEKETQRMLTLHDAETGRVEWETLDDYEQRALWSPDSRYVALTLRGRYAVEIRIVDTDDFSERVVPLPAPPEGARDTGSIGTENRALNWVDTRTLRCRADFPVKERHMGSVEYTYTVPQSGKGQFE